MFGINWRALLPAAVQAPATGPAPAARPAAPPAVVTPPAAVPAVTARPPALASPLVLAGNEYLPEDDVDRASLGDVFLRAFMRVSYDDDGDLWVQEADSPRILVTVEPPRRMIRLAAAYRFKEGTAEEAKIRLANRANTAMIVARFRPIETDRLMADFFIYYEKGLLAAQLVHSARMFGRITMAAVRESDSEDLLL